MFHFKQVKTLPSFPTVNFRCFSFKICFCFKIHLEIENIGAGFEAPKGSNRDISSGSSVVISSGESSISIFINGFKFLPLRASFITLFRLSFTSLKGVFSGEKLKPAARECPPKPSNNSPISQIHSYKCSPSIPLAEHFICFVSSE